MPKLAWVVLPLVLAAAIAMVPLLRGRARRRQLPNAGFSLLQLTDVAITAGLGVVANQHLPVVDWHHLFGDAEVALVAPRQRFAVRGLDMAALGTLLRHTAGVGLVRAGIRFRTAPSSGALFSTELYVLAVALAVPA